MLFNSLTFLVFFAIVYLLFWAMPGRAPRNTLLLLASYVFYGAWSPPYVLLLALSTSMDWILARAIWRSTSVRTRKLWLTVSLLGNLGVLGYFKYGDFLLRNFSAVVSALGIHYAAAPADIVLPIGISFYTFASISYTMDVYRGHLKGDSPFLDYALFVSFFPHLVAGPIVRANVLLPQIRESRRPSRRQVGWGLILVVFGLFSKVVLADHLLAPVVDRVYADPVRCGLIDIWAALFGFSGQIYFDFSGYSLCAIGLALCFGFAFPDNFHYPYAATGFADFWRRWHISLSTWLRDYLYIPLGGNRGGDLAMYRNLMLTMLLGGLWHGASWNYVLWGGLHGSYLIGERILRKRRAGIAPDGGRAGLGFTLFTFLVISLSWIPFRTNSMNTVGEMLSGLFRLNLDSSLYVPDLLCSLILMSATVCWHFRMRSSSLEAVFARMNNPLRVAAVSASLIGLYLCSGGSGRAFIYFQF